MRAQAGHVELEDTRALSLPWSTFREIAREASSLD